MDTMKKQYDVVIIGAGVVGSAIARELSRYKLSIAVLEKNLDVCNETSGRNSAVVHGGFANPIGSLKAKCCVEGNRIMDQLGIQPEDPFIIPAGDQHVSCCHYGSQCSASFLNILSVLFRKALRTSE